MKILVIEEEIFIRRMLKIMLEAKNYQIILAPDGPSGITQAQLEKPDVILLDGMMPGMDGWSVLEILKRLSETVSIPVIMLSSMHGSHITRARDLGAFDYIVKPFDYELLIASLEKVSRVYDNDYDDITYIELPNRLNISLCYSPDGKKIASGCEGSTIEEWDVKTGNCIAIYKDYSDFASITSVTYKPDGKKILATVFQDNKITEWDIKTRSCRFYEGHSAPVTSASYSPDGKKIISSSKDNTIKEWDTETQKCIRTIRNIPGLFIQGVDMRDLHPDSEINDEEREILRQYGVILDGSSGSGKKDIVIVEEG